MLFPLNQIRAVYNDKTIRVYQAYSDAIADSALAKNTFQSPAFSMNRMTWIKPSFLWMMYRCGWGKKEGQNRILAIDVTLDGFQWALEHSCLSHPPHSMSKQEWEGTKSNTPVRIQWDPERDLFHTPLPYRSIQIGLSKKAVHLYVNEWIHKITEVTDLSNKIHSLILNGNIQEAKSSLPIETPYEINLGSSGFRVGDFGPLAVLNTL